MANKLGQHDRFNFQSIEDVFGEFRKATQGGIADYSGITYSKIEQNKGVFWPCPTPEHPGTPRLFEGGAFAHPDGKARFHPIEYRPPAEDVDTEYPLFMTSGRVVSQYLSGTQTRRIGPLVDQYPSPQVEMHPQLAVNLGVKNGEMVRVESRRGELTLPALVVKTIRPDTIFIPYHWPGDQSANRVTNRALDPISKIPEFKVCACKLEPLGRPAPSAAETKAYASA